LHTIPPAWIIPAVGQGALAVMTRADRPDLLRLTAGLEHAPTRLRVACERAFLRTLRGGCQVPAGALAELTAGAGGGLGVRLEGVLAAPDGSSSIRGEVEGPAAGGEELGRRLAEDLLARG